jgi:signal peptidase II
VKNSRRIVVVLFIVLTCLGCDQATKLVAYHHLSRSVPLTFLGDSVRFQYVENLGAFLSLGAGLSPSIRVAVFVVGVSVILAGLLFYVVRASRLSRYEVMAAALVIGGGLGNLIDRVWFGFVRDFANLGIGPVRTGVFNLADVAITAGALVLAIHVLGSKREKEAASS